MSGDNNNNIVYPTPGQQQDGSPPSYDQFLASTPAKGNYTLSYWSNLVSPEAPLPSHGIVFVGQPPPPQQQLPVTATVTPEFKTSKFGITSNDSVLNNDSKALLDFFIQHCSTPKMSVNVHGYRRVTVRSKDKSHSK